MRVQILIGLIFIGACVAQDSGETPQLNLEDEVTHALIEAMIKLDIKNATEAPPPTVDPNDPASMDTQIANTKSKLQQARASLMQEATKILVSKYGMGIVGSLGDIDANALLDSVFPSSAVSKRKKRQYGTVVTGSCRGTPLCDNSVHVRFRSISGKCNNKNKTDLGAAVSPIRRLLKQASYADGFNEMRSLSILGTPLPGARDLSNKLMAEAVNPVFDATVNHLHMQFGQFIAHDLIFMPSSTAPDGKTLNCNACDSSINDENCAPIPVPTDDAYFPFSENGKLKCLRLTRAMNGQKGIGQRTQINQNSQFLDLSPVYGSEECEGDAVRSFSKGELKLHSYTFPLPPQDVNDTNCQSRTTYPCFKCGDFRNSLHPGLVPLHTIFIREHNRLAKTFATAKPAWTDEQIYQEARRANIAQYQHIVFSEYLPPLLGDALMTKFGLKPTTQGPSNTYDQSVNPSQSGEFATAAFRFGHSQARNEFPRLSNTKSVIGSPVDLGNNIFYAETTYEKLKTGTSAMVEGMIQTPAMKVDNQFSFAIRNQLFEIRNQIATGVDLVAVNIMRGRDVGNFPYIAYRIMMGMKRVFTWTDLQPEIPADKVALLRNMYAVVDDIDLYVGLLMENPTPGALIGPTGGYIIAEQFSALKRGDRFYYENRIAGTDPLTDRQLSETKRARLNALICKNSDGMTNTNRDIFLIKSDRIPCDSILPLDATQFL